MNVNRDRASRTLKGGTAQVNFANHIADKYRFLRRNYLGSVRMVFKNREEGSITESSPVHQYLINLRLQLQQLQTRDRNVMTGNRIVQSQLEKLLSKQLKMIEKQGKLRIVQPALPAGKARSGTPYTAQQITYNRNSREQRNPNVSPISPFGSSIDTTDGMMPTVQNTPSSGSRLHFLTSNLYVPILREEARIRELIRIVQLNKLINGSVTNVLHNAAKPQIGNLEIYRDGSDPISRADKSPDNRRAERRLHHSALDDSWRRTYSSDDRLVGAQFQQTSIHSRSPDRVRLGQERTDRVVADPFRFDATRGVERLGVAPFGLKYRRAEKQSLAPLVYRNHAMFKPTIAPLTVMRIIRQEKQDSQTNFVNKQIQAIPNLHLRIIERLLQMQRMQLEQNQPHATLSSYRKVPPALYVARREWIERFKTTGDFIERLKIRNAQSMDPGLLLTVMRSVDQTERLGGGRQQHVLRLGKNGDVKHYNVIERLLWHRDVTNPMVEVRNNVRLFPKRDESNQAGEVRDLLQTTGKKLIGYKPTVFNVSSMIERRISSIRNVERRTNKPLVPYNRNVAIIRSNREYRELMKRIEERTYFRFLPSLNETNRMITERGPVRLATIIKRYDAADRMFINTLRHQALQIYPRITARREALQARLIMSNSAAAERRGGEEALTTSTTSIMSRMKELAQPGQFLVRVAPSPAPAVNMNIKSLVSRLEHIRNSSTPFITNPAVIRAFRESSVFKSEIARNIVSSFFSQSVNKGIDPKLFFTNPEIKGTDPRWFFTKSEIKGTDPRWFFSKSVINRTDPRWLFTKSEIKGTDPRSFFSKSVINRIDPKSFFTKSEIDRMIQRSFVSKPEIIRNLVKSFGSRLEIIRNRLKSFNSKSEIVRNVIETDHSKLKITPTDNDRHAIGADFPGTILAFIDHISANRSGQLATANNYRTSVLSRIYRERANSLQFPIAPSLDRANPQPSALANNRGRMASANIHRLDAAISGRWNRIVAFRFPVAAAIELNPVKQARRKHDGIVRREDGQSRLPIVNIHLFNSMNQSTVGPVLPERSLAIWRNGLVSNPPAHIAAMTRGVIRAIRAKAEVKEMQSRNQSSPAKPVLTVLTRTTNVIMHNRQTRNDVISKTNDFREKRLSRIAAQPLWRHTPPPIARTASPNHGFVQLRPPDAVRSWIANGKSSVNKPGALGHLGRTAIEKRIAAVTRSASVIKINNSIIYRHMLAQASPDMSAANANARANVNAIGGNPANTHVESLVQAKPMATAALHHGKIKASQQKTVTDASSITPIAVPTPSLNYLRTKKPAAETRPIEPVEFRQVPNESELEQKISSILSGMPQMNVDRLADKIYKVIEKKISFERQRRGL